MDSKNANKPNFKPSETNLTPYIIMSNAYFHRAVPKKQTQLTHNVTPHLIRGPNAYPKSKGTESKSFGVHSCALVPLYGNVRRRFGQPWRHTGQTQCHLGALPEHKTIIIPRFYSKNDEYPKKHKVLNISESSFRIPL